MPPESTTVLVETAKAQIARLESSFFKLQYHQLYAVAAFP